MKTCEIFDDKTILFKDYPRSDSQAFHSAFHYNWSQTNERQQKCFA